VEIPLSERPAFHSLSGWFGPPLSGEKNILTSPRSRLRENPLMNNWLHKRLEGLGTAYPGASNSYWRTMPLGRMKKLLAAAFFTVSVLGFVLDLLLLNHPHLGRGLVWPLLNGRDCSRHLGR
jgi:hypothetical protein